MINWFTERRNMMFAVKQGHGVLDDGELGMCDVWCLVAVKRHFLGRPLSGEEVNDVDDVELSELAAYGLVKPAGNDDWEPVTASEAGEAIWGDILARHGIALDLPNTPAQIVANAITQAKTAIDESVATWGYYGECDPDVLGDEFDNMRCVNEHANELAALLSLIAGNH